MMMQSGFIIPSLDCWIFDLAAKFLSLCVSRQHYRVVKPLSIILQGSSSMAAPLQRIPSVFDRGTDSS